MPATISLKVGALEVEGHVIWATFPEGPVPMKDLDQFKTQALQFMVSRQLSLHHDEGPYVFTDGLGLVNIAWDINLTPEQLSTIPAEMIHDLGPLLPEPEPDLIRWGFETLELSHPKARENFTLEIRDGVLNLGLTDAAYRECQGTDSTGTMANDWLEEAMEDIQGGGYECNREIID
jgi:hypothetical protein